MPFRSPEEALFFPFPSPQNSQNPLLSLPLFSDPTKKPAPVSPPATFPFHPCVCLALSGVHPWVSVCLAQASAFLRSLYTCERVSVCLCVCEIYFSPHTLSLPLAPFTSKSPFTSPLIGHDKMEKYTYFPCRVSDSRFLTVRGVEENISCYSFRGSPNSVAGPSGSCPAWAVALHGDLISELGVPCLFPLRLGV